jgi:hypothetical protein
MTSLKKNFKNFGVRKLIPKFKFKIFPIKKLRLNNFSLTLILPPYQTQTSERGEERKKIKEQMIFDRN